MNAFTSLRLCLARGVLSLSVILLAPAAVSHGQAVLVTGSNPIIGGESDASLFGNNSTNILYQVVALGGPSAPGIYGGVAQAHLFVSGTMDADTTAAQTGGGIATSVTAQTSTGTFGEGLLTGAYGFESRAAIGHR